MEEGMGFSCAANLARHPARWRAKISGQNPLAQSRPPRLNSPRHSNLANMRYAVAACQTDFACPTTRAEIASRVDRMLEMIDGAVIGYRPFFPVRLVVFPEFAHAAPVYPTVAELREHLAVQLPNEHTERYIARARQHGVFIQTGTFIEFDPKWPGVLFNTTCLIGPGGRAGCSRVGPAVRRPCATESSGYFFLTTSLAGLRTPLARASSRYASASSADTLSAGEISLTRFTRARSYIVRSAADSEASRLRAARLRTTSATWYTSPDFSFS